jgi:two-component system, OmpR family, phosphate regulon sensor histidine kinase PhoR
MADVDAIARIMVDALDEPALVVEGTIVRLANPAAQKLFGDRIEGRDVRLAIRHPQALERILAHRSAEIDVTGIAEPGRSWRLIIREFRSNCTLVRMIDRSGSVSAEKMRVDFVANASHELRTPLATVIGYAETLSDDDELPKEVRDKFARTIRDEAARMLRLIEDLMSLSRIQADRFVEPAELVRMDEIVAEAIANATHLQADRKCRINVDSPSDLPQVKGDRAQLVQVFDNLLSNAARYGCDDASSTIDVALSAAARFVAIIVTDHGAGIAREHIPRLTERFYRVDEARTRGTGGTGLGLAIVKHIVERHRGELEIRSEVGVGTSVSVRLPISA